MLFQLRNDILETVLKKMDSVELRLSGEISKITNTLDQELGLTVGENNLVVEEDDDE